MTIQQKRKKKIMSIEEQVRTSCFFYYFTRSIVFAYFKVAYQALSTILWRKFANRLKFSWNSWEILYQQVLSNIPQVQWCCCIFPLSGYATLRNIFIDREAGEIICLVASVCLSVDVFVRALLLHIYHYQSKVFVCVFVINCCFDRLRHRGRSRF